MSDFGLRLAARIAWRESRSAPGRFLFVILAVAVGVGSLAGVRGFSDAFRAMLLRDARTLMAADLTVRIFAEPSRQQEAAMAELERKGVRRTRITETVSMVSSPAAPEPVLVALKAVDPAVYPFYGSVRLDPPGSLKERLQPDAAVASSDLLLRLGLEQGGTLKLGGREFRIAGVLKLEPDRMTGTLNVGPRVMISTAGLERAGLMQTGSRASQRFLFRLGEGAPGIREARRTLQRAFPEGMISDFRQTHPVITRGLNRSTTFLSLVSLIALIVGALGVGTALHAHLQQKLDSIAVMKCIGARSRQVVRIYLLQGLMLGAAGTALGVAFSAVVQRMFPRMIRNYFPTDAGVSWRPLPLLEAALVGILVTLLFTLPPLLSVRRVKPALILRREMADAKPGWRRRFAQARASIAAGALLVAAVGGIAAWLSDSWEMGAIFAGTLAAGVATLSGVAWILLRAVRRLLRWSPWKLPLVIRHGLANLYRPGNHAEAALVALGIGVTFTLAIYLIQRGVTAKLLSSAPQGRPNVFFINITERERDGMLDLLKKQRGVEGSPDLVASVSARLSTVDGVPVEKLPLRGPVRRFFRTRQVTWRAEAPDRTEIVKGKWWDPKQKSAEPAVSVEEEAAEILRIGPGARLEWEIAGRTLAARVAAVHRMDPAHILSRIEFIFNQGALASAPVMYNGAARVRAPDVPAMQRAIYEKFPTITVINVAEVLEIVQEMVDQIAMVIRFIAAFAILAGAIILAAGVAGTRFRRVREVVILKTLGATRRRVAAIFSVEFLALGSVAGLIGSLLASAFSALTLTRLLDADFQFDALLNAAAVALTALTAAAAGWLASFRILGQKPLEILRQE